MTRALQLYESATAVNFVVGQVRLFCEVLIDRNPRGKVQTSGPDLLKYAFLWQGADLFVGPGGASLALNAYLLPPAAVGYANPG